MKALIALLLATDLALIGVVLFAIRALRRSIEALLEVKAMLNTIPPSSPTPVSFMD